MQYKRRTDEEKDLIFLSDTQFELQSQFDTEAIRHVARDMPQPTRPEEPRAVSTERAMAAAAPGSDYWLG